MRIRLLISIALLLVVSRLMADDWPQFRGPRRDGVSTEKGLLKKWPEKGPKLVWSFKDAGLGFSSYSVVGNTFYTLGSRDNDEIILALDALKGTELWTVKLGPIFTSEENVQWGDGPRSTPTIDGKRLYALGAQGELVCLDISAAKPKEVWRKNLIKDFGGVMMTGWGYSESPLVDGKNLIVTPGGAGGTVVALDKSTGAVVWRSKELTYKAPYTSVIAVDIQGVRQYIQQGYVDEKAGGFISGIRATDGSVLWTQNLFKRQSHAMASSPIIKGNRVYVTSGQDGGCHLFEINAGQKPKDLYAKEDRQNFNNTHGGVVLIGDYIYGHSYFKGWQCQNLATGAVEWDDDFSLPCKSGAITSAEGMLYLYTDKGVTALAKADPKELKIISKFKIPEHSKFPGMRKTSAYAGAWSHPVIANGRLYLRDSEFVFCYDIRDKK
jgi:outer membrane protein assembly factor BamB